MYWLIEPHSDDVYLSLHQHIVSLWKEVPKTIVTVFSTPKRSLESRSYAEATGCSYLSLECREGGGLTKRPGEVPPFSEWPLVWRAGDVIIFPLGLQHPDHLAVVSRVPKGKVVWRYLDTPYYGKQKLAGEIQEKISGMVIHSLLYASVSKWKHIPKFKSQAKFFHFNPPESLPRIEMVLR